MDLTKLVKEATEWIASIGADPEGGQSRLLYDDSWVEAQHGLKERFEKAGMTATFDAVGNLSGVLKGSKYPNETIASGSHVDTVVNGGPLDGQYGIVAAYCAALYLQEKYGQPLRNIEVVSFAEEEGSRFPMTFWGSKNFVHEAKAETTKGMADFEGVDFVEAMHNAGFDFRDESQPLRDDIKAFVEIHIEQGQVLEIEQETIGVVNAIVGQKRFTVNLKGQANHAGTTPMGYRRDAVVTFARIAERAVARVREIGDPLVLTFGKVEPKPNTVNVVPGGCLFTIDMRHTQQDDLDAFEKEMVQIIEEIAKEEGVEADINKWMDEAPVPMDQKIVDVVEEAAKESGYKYRVMHSGAGHDSQVIAPHFPTAMLFTPSIGGISHNPAEATKLEDLVAGVEVLAKALYKLAYEE